MQHHLPRHGTRGISTLYRIPFLLSGCAESVNHRPTSHSVELPPQQQVLYMQLCRLHRRCGIACGGAHASFFEEDLQRASPAKFLFEIHLAR